MTTGVAATCPHCAAPVDPGYLFCEECGGELTPTAGATPPPPVPGAPAPGEEIGGLGGASGVLDAALEEARTGEPTAPMPVGPPRRPGVVVVDVDLETLPATCAVCSGEIAADGYCGNCGAPAARPRDHWVEEPAPWVALVCDRGVRHTINQDGGASAAAAEPGSFAALVVCDGVSSAARSEVASLAAARAARDVLAAPRPAPDQTGRGEPTVPMRSDATVPIQLAPPQAASAEPAAPAAEPAAPPPAAPPAAPPATPAVPDAVAPPPDPPAGSTSVQSHASWLAAAMREAGAAAQAEAAAAASDPPEPNSPSCTFVGAVLDSGTVVVGWVGDSRAYWLPDEGVPVQLTTDDSWASEAIAVGFSREEAERAPQAHSITRWLGLDAPDPVPRTAARRVEEPGWLLLCSDGLWNYCSEAADLHDLVRASSATAGAQPRGLAEALVDWANARGGHDNITVALARVGR